jgi:hypothetical protein
VLTMSHEPTTNCMSLVQSAEPTWPSRRNNALVARSLSWLLSPGEPPSEAELADKGAVR